MASSWLPCRISPPTSAPASCRHRRSRVCLSVLLINHGFCTSDPDHVRVAGRHLHFGPASGRSCPRSPRSWTSRTRYYANAADRCWVIELARPEQGRAVARTAPLLRVLNRDRTTRRWPVTLPGRNPMFVCNVDHLMTRLTPSSTAAGVRRWMPISPFAIAIHGLGQHQRTLIGNHRLHHRQAGAIDRGSG